MKDNLYRNPNALRWKMPGAFGAFIVIISIILLMIFNTITKLENKYTLQSYELWCKVHNRHDLTYIEWKDARKEGFIK